MNRANGSSVKHNSLKRAAHAAHVCLTPFIHQIPLVNEKADLGCGGLCLYRGPLIGQGLCKWQLLLSVWKQEPCLTPALDDATPPPGSQCIQLAKHSKGRAHTRLPQHNRMWHPNATFSTVCDNHADNTNTNTFCFRTETSTLMKSPIRYFRLAEKQLTVHSISIIIAVQATLAPLTELQIAAY